MPCGCVKSNGTPISYEDCCCWYNYSGHYSKCNCPPSDNQQSEEPEPCPDVLPSCIECDGQPTCCIPACDTKCVEYEECQKPSCNPRHRCILFTTRNLVSEEDQLCNACNVPLYCSMKSKFKNQFENAEKYWVCFCKESCCPRCTTPSPP